MGVELGGQVAPISNNATPKADDYIASAAQKYEKNDYRGTLADLNRAIQLNPNSANAYSSRGDVKADKLQDTQGGLADLNRAIQLDSKLAIAYYNRGILKATNLQDIQDAIADLNRTIQIDPNYADAYSNMGILKHDRSNDKSGGIADMQQAAKLYQQQGNTKYYQLAIDKLKQWRSAN